MENKTKELWNNLGQLEAAKCKETGNPRQQQILEKKLDIRMKISKVVIEELKQRVAAFAAKFRRCQERSINRWMKCFKCNKIFQSN